MALNLGQQITTPAQPNLGTPAPAYDQGFFGTSFGGLNVYFAKLTAIFSALLGPRGGKYINAPYGAFQDGTDQTAANTTTAYAITFDTTDFSNGVTLSNSSRLNVAQAGIYNLQFSIQFKNTTNDGQDVDVWFRKNGTNIANSNSRFHPPARKSSGDPSNNVWIISNLGLYALSLFLASINLSPTSLETIIHSLIIGCLVFSIY